jgi:hypothetical protein
MHQYVNVNDLHYYSERFQVEPKKTTKKTPKKKQKIEQVSSNDVEYLGSKEITYQERKEIVHPFSNEMLLLRANQDLDTLHITTFQNFISSRYGFVSRFISPNFFINPASNFNQDVLHDYFYSSFTL